MAVVCRALRIALSEPPPPPLLSLFADFRLLTNEILRQALASGKTSLRALDRFARDRAFQHQVTGTYANTATGIALSLARGHRKRLRRGMPSQLPYVRRAFLRADDRSFHLDVESERVRLSLRSGVWSSVGLRLSPYHRQVLAIPGLRMKQFHLDEDHAVLFYEKPAPEPYPPTSLLALDSNERSLDGVCLTPSVTQAVTVPFPEIPVLQQRHADRR